ncbi:MAG: response regulator transcription factor, partial [Candidatus Saccharimonadales bacterium]
MKILLVEDHTSLAKGIKRQLTERHYVVDVVTTGEEALALVQTITYNLIILDLSLPGMSGDLTCAAIRKQGITTPILILTGTMTVTSRVALLNSGADDYVTKPFDSDELRARVATLTRRKQADTGPPSHIYLDGLDIDYVARTVHRRGIPIELRRKEFDILVYLVGNCGRVVTRNMLAQRIWNTNSKREKVASIDVHITTLRNRIDRPFDTTIIKTVYGLGYKV